MVRWVLYLGLHGQVGSVPRSAWSGQVKWFISEAPVGVHERTSMKEHLV